jgi:hypothetical protein
MEINYCLKKGKGKGNLYLPSFVVTLFCRRALLSPRSYVVALLCRRALMSPRSYVARSFVARSFCGALFLRCAFVAIPLATVARELHCSKTCIFNIKRGWQENRLERPMRIGVGKVSLLKFTFTLIMY